MFSFDLSLGLRGGRNNKGAFIGAQIDQPGREGYISAELDDGTSLAIQSGNSGTYSIAMPAGGLKKGRTLTVILGGNSKDSFGIKACKERTLNKLFILYRSSDKANKPNPPIWAGGTTWTSVNSDSIVAVCTMHILGGATHHIRAYVPAVTKPGQSFPVLVRPEDESGTLSHNTLNFLEISVNGQTLDAKFEQVEQSTCVRATVALSTEGIYRFNVREKDSQRETLTNPTVCSQGAEPVYWGMIHGHTEMSDGTGKLDQYFHQLKNEVMLDFAATGDHDHLWETPDEFWTTTCSAVKHWHQPGKFVTFLGYEWAKWRKNGDGDRNVYYLQDDRPMYRSDDSHYPSPPDLFRTLAQNKEQAIVIPHHTGHGGNFCDWKDHSPEYERLVEIFQFRGSYECSAQAGNTVPEKAGKTPQYTNGYVQNALALGWRVGFTAGGDDHMGQWGTEFHFGFGEIRYKQGLMSVEAVAKTRAGIYEAMYNRRGVATTGARMLLTYRLDGRPMGSELSLKNLPELHASRKLDIEFHGTAKVDRIEIIRNNSIVHSAPGADRGDMNVVWDDREPIDKIWMPAARLCDHPFTFYYVRVIQQDGEVAWASPLWIDPH